MTRSSRPQAPRPTREQVQLIVEATGWTRKRAEECAARALALQSVSDEQIEAAAAEATSRGEDFNAESLLRRPPAQGPVLSRAKSSGLVRIVPIDSIRPSAINDEVYRPPCPDDPDIRAMADTMQEHGVLQALTVTRDGFILSGHRRYCAATVAGLDEVPVVIEDITRDDPDFPRLLVIHNQQRQKSVAELLAEQVVQRSGEDAHRDLVQHRIARSRKATAKATVMAVEKVRSRSAITAAKRPMLDAVASVIEELREFWPLSLRTIHYNLLNDPPPRNANRAGSAYRNDRKCYKDLSDLCTRARFEGLLPFDAIHDPTRPVTSWNIHRNASDYIRGQIDQFLRGYWRDLLQSQPDHIEVIGEKNTLQPIIDPVCSDYTVPLTIGRGFCSVPPRKEMYDRWKRSGKNNLILIVMSDHDPDGEMIADSLVGYMRDDFGIPPARIKAVRAALTADQCIEFNIATDVEAKHTSTNYARFVRKHGTGACELEAVPPRRLQRMLRDAIESILDLDAFKAEQACERDDAAEIEAARLRALAALGPAGLD